MQEKAVFPARYSQIVHICTFVMNGARMAGFDDDEQFRIQLACDEACTNIIEHGYGGEDLGEIHASYRTSKQGIIIKLHDYGRSFVPEKVVVTKPPLKLESDADFEQLKRGGLGLHFMRTIMDEIQFAFDEEAGNTLTMKKFLNK